MEARKIQFKVFVKEPKEVDVDPIVPVLHQWIRERAFDELLIDVTDYAHVPNGPALLLVGHGSDYCVDFADGRPGLLYSRKREAPKDAKDCVTDALKRTLAAAKKLEEEKSLPKKLVFSGEELLFRVNDRLLGPNTDETLKTVEPVLRSVLETLYAGTPFTLAREGSPKELFTVRVKAPGAPGVGALLTRIA
ncbi:MAG TPA: hypothetical protein VHE30_25445 [Polyangiaceae bacterium]|nr:hypothetical protein [Polyangiaceae bacterium]